MTMELAAHARKRMPVATMTDPKILGPAMIDAFRKLDPRLMVKNPAHGGRSNAVPTGVLSASADSVVEDATMSDTRMVVMMRLMSGAFISDRMRQMNLETRATPNGAENRSRRPPCRRHRDGARRSGRCRATRKRA